MPTRAAALISIGWYLLVPGLHYGAALAILVATDEPLSSWHQRGSYDSAEKCEAARAHSKKYLLRKLETLRARYGNTPKYLDDPDAWGINASIGQIEQSKCIASDDPRLKCNCPKRHDPSDPIWRIVP